MNMEISKAPWTQEQVFAIRARQLDKTKHPYTCGSDSSHTILFPVRDKLYCITCGYEQDWVLETDTRKD